MFATKESFLSTQLNEKTIRKVCPHYRELMMVEFEFKKGGIGELHSHEEHEQVGYILEGTFYLHIKILAFKTLSFLKT